MIDAKEVGRRVLERAGKQWVSANKVVDVLAGLDDVVAEEIEKAQNPKPKTRGEEVAENFIRTVPSGGDPDKEQMLFGHLPPLMLGSPDFSCRNACAAFRLYLASLIDSERADAAKQEREACAAIAEKFRFAVTHTQLMTDPPQNPTAVNIARAIKGRT